MGKFIYKMQASFGNRSQKDQKIIVNKEDKLLGSTVFGASNSFAPVYAFA